MMMMMMIIMMMMKIRRRTQDNASTARICACVIASDELWLHDEQ